MEHFFFFIHIFIFITYGNVNRKLKKKRTKTLERIQHATKKNCIEILALGIFFLAWSLNSTSVIFVTITYVDFFHVSITFFNFCNCGWAIQYSIHLLAVEQRTEKLSGNKHFFSKVYKYNIVCEIREVIFESLLLTSLKH